MLLNTLIDNDTILLIGLREDGMQAIQGNPSRLDAKLAQPAIAQQLSNINGENKSFTSSLLTEVFATAIKLAFNKKPQLLEICLQSIHFEPLFRSSNDYTCYVALEDFKIFEALTVLAASDIISSDIKNKCINLIIKLDKTHLLNTVTPLHCAIAKGDIKKVDQLLSASSDKGAMLTSCFSGSTPLEFAIRLNQIEILRLLIAHGANIEAHGGHKSALEFAIEMSKGRASRELLGKGAKINVLSMDSLKGNIPNLLLLKVIMSHPSNVKLEKFQHKDPFVIQAVKDLNADYHRFSAAVKGLHRELPIEIIGKIMSYVVDYKTDERLTQDSKYIVSAWQYFNQHRSLAGYSSPYTILTMPQCQQPPRVAKRKHTE